MQGYAKPKQNRLDIYSICASHTDEFLFYVHLWWDLEQVFIIYK